MTQYFIEVYPQDKLRIELLTAQRGLVDCMKRCEIFKRVREEKVKETANLKAKLKEVIVLFNTFKEQMPKLKIKIEEKEIPRKEKPKSLYDYSKQLQELEKSIVDIENRLKGLGN